MPKVFRFPASPCTVGLLGTGSTSMAFGLVLGLLAFTGIADAVPQPHPTLTQSIAATPTADIRTTAQQATTKARELANQKAPWLQVIHQYEEALKLWEQIREPNPGDLKNKAQTLYWLAQFNSVIGENQKSLDYSSKALAGYRNVGDRVSEGLTFTLMGGVYSELGDNLKAIEVYQKALPLFQEKGQAPFLSTTLGWIGNAYGKLGETQRALDSYRQALKLAEQAQDPDSQSNTLDEIATFYANLGDLNQAIAYLKQAKSVNPKFEPEKSAASIALQALFSRSDSQISSNLFNAYGKPDGQQIQLLSELAQTRLKEGNLREAYNYFNLLGRLYDITDNYRQSFLAYQQALAISKKTGSRAGQTETLLSIAGVYTTWGKKQDALDYCLQALAIQRQLQNRAGEAGTLQQIGDLYASLSATDLARDTYQQALALFQKQSNPGGEGNTLRSLASLLYAAGERRQAAQLYQQAQMVYHKAGSQYSEVSALTGLSRTYVELGDAAQALQTIDAAIALTQTAGFTDLEAVTLGVKGRVLLRAGDYRQAQTVAEQTLALFQKRGKPQGSATVLGLLGDVYYQLKDTPKALEHHNQALAFWKDLGDRNSEADTLYTIAKIEFETGASPAALTHIDGAIAIIEGIRSNVTSHDLRTAYFATKQDYYKLKIDILMQLHQQNPTAGYDAQALNTSERNRARSLLDLLTEARVDIRQGVDSRLLEQEQTLQEQINGALKQQFALAQQRETRAAANTLKADIEQLLNRYKEVQAQIKRASPRYAALTQPQPLTLKEIQTQVLDPDSILLEYSLGEARSYLWAVTPTALYSYELPKRADIEADVNLFRSILTARTAPQTLSKPLEALSLKLLQPVAALLQKKRLLVVTDGGLRYVPFAALPTPKTETPTASNRAPLVVDHEVVHLPSASTLAVLRQDLANRKPAPQAIAVLADPVFDSSDERIKSRKPGIAPTLTPPVSMMALNPLSKSRGSLQRLPATRREAESVLALFPASQRMAAFDFNASRALALNPKLMQYQILHFATHGILNETNPELSGVALSLVDTQGQPQNGFLQLRDIYNLKLPAELVVLSACQTAGGQDIKGEGIIGLTRGFMYAGTRSTVVSLWSVDDEATADLMTRFYQKMRQNHLSAAAALRQAQVEMWTQPNWRSPYFWAAFQLQGDWKWALR